MGQLFHDDRDRYPHTTNAGTATKNRRVERNPIEAGHFQLLPRVPLPPLSSPCATSQAATSHVSRAILCYDVEILALASASEGIILAQRVGFEIVPGQYASQVGMVRENNAEHVEHLTLKPVGPAPDGRDAGHRRLGVVDETLDPQPMLLGMRQQRVNHPVSIARIGEVEVVHTS